MGVRQVVGHEAAVRAERGRVDTREVRRWSVHSYVHDAGGAGQTIADEVEPAAGAARRYQVCGVGLEGHVMPIRVDGGDAARGVARAARQRVRAHEIRLPENPVAHEDLTAGATSHEVRGRGLERLAESVAADDGTATAEVALRAVRGDAGDLGGPGGSVPNEDLLQAGPTRDQIGGTRREGDEATIAADRRKETVLVAHLAVRGDAHQFRGLVHQVTDKDLRHRDRIGANAVQET